MLVLLVSVLFVVLGVVLLALGTKWWGYDENQKEKNIINSFKKFMYYHDEGFCIIGSIVTFISGCFLMVMLISACGIAMTTPAKVLENQEQYKFLTYKLESKACQDDFGLLSNEILSEVRDWNVDLTYNKQMHNNIWVGIFYPDTYEGLETIDYESYSRTPKSSSVSNLNDNEGK